MWDWIQREAVYLWYYLDIQIRQIAPYWAHFVCRILATYADEGVLNEKGKIDYHVFKPVLFEFPTYEYFVTGEKIGDCAKMNQ